MSPKTTNNTKSRVNLSCPVCGMDLRNSPNGGVVKNNQTYCCAGCATNIGCRCVQAVLKAKTSNSRRGDRGQRNAEDRPQDNSANLEIDSSGRPTGPKKKHATARRQQSRDQLAGPGIKRIAGQAKQRDSTREQARGRSEHRGRLNKRVNVTRGQVDRIGTSGTKSK